MPAGEETSTSAGTPIKTEPEAPSTEIKREAVDPDTGEGSNPLGTTDAIQIKTEDVADQVDEAQGSSLSSQENSENMSQEMPSTSQENESPHDTPNSSQNHLSEMISSQEDIFMSSQEPSQDIREPSDDVKQEMKAELSHSEGDKDRTSVDMAGVAQRELCRPPGDVGNVPNAQGSQEMKPFQPEYNPAEFLRWPKVCQVQGVHKKVVGTQKVVIYVCVCVWGGV